MSQKLLQMHAVTFTTTRAYCKADCTKQGWWNMERPRQGAQRHANPVHQCLRLHKVSPSLGRRLNRKGEAIFLGRAFQSVFHTAPALLADHLIASFRGEVRERIFANPRDVIWHTKTQNKIEKHVFSTGRMHPIDRHSSSYPLDPILILTVLLLNSGKDK